MEDISLLDAIGIASIVWRTWAKRVPAIEFYIMGDAIRPYWLRIQLLDL